MGGLQETTFNITGPENEGSKEMPKVDLTNMEVTCD